MTEVDTLARRAREALAHCGGGSLHIHGVDDGMHGQATDVLLYDDGGRPTFLCAPDSAVTSAARDGRTAVLQVVPPPQAWDGMTALVLTGRLRVVGREEVDGAPVEVVGLDIASVVVEHDDPLAPTVSQVEVSLDSYRGALPDLLATAAQRIVRHTNNYHGADLREYVASLRGVPVTEIAAAEIATMDVQGMDVRWLDRRGAHTAHIVFPEPADSPGTLGARLRDTLAGSRR